MTILPERIFTHPVAQGTRQMAQSADRRCHIQRAARRATASRTILEKPEAFGGDAHGGAPCSRARRRASAIKPPAEAVKTVPEMMWHAAVRIEDGDLMMAEQRLDEAEKALREAIQNGAPPDEIDRRIAELQKAMSEYARARAEKQATNTIADQTQGTPSKDMAEMMKQLRQIWPRWAPRKRPKQMLSELEQRLQDMRAQNNAGSNSQQLKAAQQLMKDMRQNCPPSNPRSSIKNFEQRQQRPNGNQRRRPIQRRQADRRGKAPRLRAPGSLAPAARDDHGPDQANDRQGLPRISNDANDAMSEARDDLKSHGAWQPRARQPEARRCREASARRRAGAARTSWRRCSTRASGGMRSMPTRRSSARAGPSRAGQRSMARTWTCPPAPTPKAWPAACVRSSMRSGTARATARAQNPSRIISSG